MKTKKNQSSPSRIRILRKAIKLTQTAMAELVGVNIRTIQKLEQAKKPMPLSRQLARVVARKTDVLLDWLEGEGEDEPILNGKGKPFRIEDFKRSQSSLHQGTHELLNGEFFGAQLTAVLRAAQKAGKAQEALEKADLFMAHMRSMYGFDRVHLLREGGAAGASLLAAEIAREEAKKLWPGVKGGELSMIVLAACEHWSQRDSSMAPSTLSQFRNEIVKALENVKFSEMLGESGS